MLFKPDLCKAILEGHKTQTRRIVKDGEYKRPRFNSNYNQFNRVVYTPGDRVKWYTGGEYAVQPGRGKKSVGRIRLTAIRQERLQDISEEDARAEGVDEHYYDNLPSYKQRVIPGYLCRAAFADLWKTVHGADSWDDNPLVWVLAFELVDD